MGIGLTTFQNLARLAATHDVSGKALMLGRQKLRLVRPGPMAQKAINTDDVGPFNRTLSECGFDVDAASMIQDDGHAETMFAKLGLSDIETLDYSEFEGASAIWDLNDPVPTEWHAKYGFIFDGGTLEHVFNVPQSFDNVHKMLALGGVFVSVTPLNGFPDHGFYQFTPELIWSFWKRGRGCDVLACHSFHQRASHVQDFLDPEVEGARPKVRTRLRRWGTGPEDRLLMWYAVRKSATDVPSHLPLQSDYVKRWTHAEAS